ncbi:dioxygenase family protein [Variovorax saccharolyticus]|uniref:dioxygenase family protein n=1 Tax=Variovorax saccharolyticus TaxID=3053516 RepID=UPI0025791340|nr:MULTISPECIES: dioxygenase [unclassified Variovorax]MDM0017591.1 dioxygenase [Variovorax sp. J22R187]MDM0028732.1 dioxygenase [Variovorax sp. J31P216]
MNFVTTPESVLQIALQAMERTPDPRLRSVMAALTRHLHAFAREVELTEDEFERALEFLVAIGQASGDKKNEVVLAADLLGVSTLVALLNNQDPQGESPAALLGPFWRANAPVCDCGESIARSETPGVPLEVAGTVRDAAGRPVADATIDVWQASPVGLYENQDPGQEDMNLRGRFQTDADGGFHFRSVRPAGYPVPTDGPCGELLRAQLRHPNRPAHLHFMVSKPGHKVLVTQVFADDDENLESDPVFGVTRRLIGRFEPQQGGQNATLQYDFVLEPGEMKFPRAPIP